MHEENNGRKLEHQQEQNKSVQDKLDLWMGKNSSRKRGSCHEKYSLFVIMADYLKQTSESGFKK